MIKFIRTTHVDGEFKGEHPFPGHQFYGLGPHALNPDNPISFSEFVEVHSEYAKTYHDFEMPSIASLLDDLSSMVSLGYAQYSPDKIVQLEIRGCTSGCEPERFLNCYIAALPGGPEKEGTVLMLHRADQLDKNWLYKASVDYCYKGRQPVLIRVRKAGIIPFETNSVITEEGLIFVPKLVTEFLGPYDGPKLIDRIESRRARLNNPMRLFLSRVFGKAI